MMKYAFILVSLFLFSCGARKVDTNISKEKETTVEKTEQKDSISNEKNEKVEYNTEDSTVVIVPADSTKVMIVDGKKYFNAKIKIQKRKDKTKVNKSDKTIVVSDKKVNVKKDTTKKNKVKHIHREESKWWIIWLIIVIAAYIIYRYYINIFKFT